MAAPEGWYNLRHFAFAAQRAQTRSGPFEPDPVSTGVGIGSVTGQQVMVTPQPLQANGINRCPPETMERR